MDRHCSIAGASYGPHERNVLDLWKARGEGPRPLVVFIHGGGFRAGDKSDLPAPLLRGCLDAGLSVAAVNYRLSQQAPFPAPMRDSARAVQFLRHQAKEWNLDPARFGASGGSAGAGTSLWIGFHDDFADPANEDPVLRESTRLSCMAVTGAQTTYDPRKIRELIGGRAAEHPALLPFYGITAEEIDSPKAYALYEAASPVTHLTKDDPPAYLIYNEPDRDLPPDAKPGAGIHHPRFGRFLKEKMDALGIECVVRHADELKGKGGSAMHDEMVAFFRRHFEKAGATEGSKLK